jgi:hypothetical protein
MKPCTFLAPSLISTHKQLLTLAQNLVISIQSATWRLQVRSQGVEILTLIKRNQRKKSRSYILHKVFWMT